MFNIFKLFLLSVVVVLALTQCSNNPLLKSSTNPDGVEGLSSPQTVTSLKACTFLEGKSSCCSADTINNFKSKVQADIDSLQKTVGDEDQKKAKAMAAVGRYLQKVGDITKKLSEFTNSSRNLGTDDMFSQDEVAKTKKIMSDGFKGMLKNRSSCFTYAFQIGTKLKCMACMTDTSSFVSGGSLKLSNKTCNNFFTKCREYLASIDGMAKFENSDLIQKSLADQENMMNKAVQFMDEVKGLMDKAKGGDAGAAMQLLAKAFEMQSLGTNITNAGQVKIPKANVPLLPPGCNSVDCNVLCERIITSNGLNLTALAKGAMDFNVKENLPLWGQRRLTVATDGFDIETQVNSGFESSVSFSENPGNADPDTGSGGSFSFRVSILALLSLGFYLML